MEMKDDDGTSGSNVPTSLFLLRLFRATATICYFTFFPCKYYKHINLLFIMQCLPCGCYEATIFVEKCSYGFKRLENGEKLELNL